MSTNLNMFKLNITPILIACQGKYERVQIWPL